MHSSGRLAGPLGGEAASAHSAQPLPPHHSQSPETTKVLEALRACQDEARRKHVGIYEFGDVDSEEEDDGGALSGGAVVCEAADLLWWHTSQALCCEVVRACLNVAQQVNTNARCALSTGLNFPAPPLCRLPCARRQARRPRWPPLSGTCDSQRVLRTCCAPCQQ